MAFTDNLSDNAKDIMDDPDKKQQIEQMAKDKGMTIEQAKDHFIKKESTT